MKKTKRMDWLRKQKVRRFRIINGVKFEVDGFKVKDIEEARMVQDG